MDVTSGIDPSLHPVSQVWMKGRVPVLEQEVFCLHGKEKRKTQIFKKNQTQQNNTKPHNIGSGQFPRKAAVAAEMKMLASF